MDVKADVVIPAGHPAAVVDRCVRSVLEHSAPILHRVIVIETAPDSPACSTFDGIASLSSQVHVLRVPGHLGYAASCNRGLDLSRNDVVLLDGGCAVGPEWLDELAAVAWAGERTACVAPLWDLGEKGAPVERDAGTLPFAFNRAAIEAACAGLPRATTVPSVGGSCVYLPRDKIDAVGLFDSSLSCACAAIDDWLSRAHELGLVTKRANHVYVGSVGLRSLSTFSALDLQARSVAFQERHRQLRRQIDRFRRSLDARIAMHAVRIAASGKLRVALDLRALPREQVGTRTYAVSLAGALADLPEVELTLLVRDPAQASGLPGRIVAARDWRDDVQVIHRPAQVFDPHDLALLFRSSAHLVLTYQDLIAYRSPLAAASDAWFERYRATSSLTVPAVQRVVAYSANTAGEIATEFGVPRDEIAVVPLGVDAGRFAQTDPQDIEVRHKLRLPSHYFFSLATDFPHKNLPTLLEAYAILRGRWRTGEAPELILAGYTSSARAGIYDDLAPNRAKDGVRFLGPVSSDQLRVLYQDALAFIFPSLYEGFGLPPLEAMAAGAPVIAMPISAVPEVVGDCALYPEGLSAASLARAMETLAGDHCVRDELRSRGLRHAEQFRWESTARATFEVYRQAVLRPSERALRSRRLLQGAILRWAVPAPAGHAGAFGPIGIREAWRELDSAIQARLRRELRRFRPVRLRLARQGQLPKAASDGRAEGMKR